MLVLTTALIAGACSNSGGGTLEARVATTTTTAVAATSGATPGTPSPTTPTSNPAAVPTPGTDPLTGCSSDDPYYPTAGGRGINVSVYELLLNVDPAADRLDGIARITAVLDAPTTSICLDLVGLEVASTSVNGTAARHTRPSTRDLLLTTESTVSGTVTIEISYGGSPSTTSTDSVGFDESGWFDLGGTAVGLSEPVGSATWFPVNDLPADKARFRFDVTVPAGSTAIANGLPDGPLDGEATPDGRRRFRWSARDEMSTYLATLAVGRFDLETSDGPNGIPVISAFAPGTGAIARQSIGRTGEVIEFLEARYGPYPWETAGGIVVQGLPGFALETQGRPVYAGDFFNSRTSGDIVVAHEIAHQWFGNRVGPAQWDDIWLNEGLTTYAEWLWTDHIGAGSVDQSAREAYDSPRGLDVPPAEPGAANLFGRSVYQRGALTIYAIRRAIGDTATDRLLRTWVERHAGGSADTERFLALVGELAGPQVAATARQWATADRLPPFPA